MQSPRSSLGFVVLVAASCNFPRLPDLPDTGDEPFGLELLAGTIGGHGSRDATGAEARFREPGGVAVDRLGTVYVADSFNHTIRRITAAGVATTLAGASGLRGSADGTGRDARFLFPAAVAVDGIDTLYVADEYNHTIRKVTREGVVTTVAGTAGMVGSRDGAGAAARFSNPAGVMVDVNGTLYVAERFGGIRTISSEGVVTTLEVTDNISEIACTLALVAFSVVVDSARNLYVANPLDSVICKITPTGATMGTGTVLAGKEGTPGGLDGTGTAARFNGPSSIAIDSADNLYVADVGNHAIRKITPAGVVTTLAGSALLPGNADGAGGSARFRGPSGVAVDIAGNAYVADTGNSTIRKVTAAGVVTTLAGTGVLSDSTDGTGAAARFAGPTGVAVDSAGDVYVTDTGNSSIRQVTPEGVVTTLAGTSGLSGSDDGTRAAARFAGPSGAAIDSAGNLYVADNISHTIRKITAEGVVTTLAGTPHIVGTEDGTGAAAQFQFPTSVAVDPANNLYIADQHNHTIRKIAADGVVTTLAGTPGTPGSADGTGGNARFDHPTGVAADASGEIYVADRENHTIRKITAGGSVTTLAGNPGMLGSADGIGSSARFNRPSALVVDGAGNIYVADTASGTIRKITPGGTTSTIAGVGGERGIRLGGTPLLANPTGLAIVGDSLIIADSDAILRLRGGAR